MVDESNVTKATSTETNSEATPRRLHEIGNYLLVIRLEISELKDQLESSEQDLQSIHNVEKALEAATALYKLVAADINRS